MLRVWGYEEVALPSIVEPRLFLSPDNTSLRRTGSLGRTVGSERTGSLGHLGRPPLYRCGRGFWLAILRPLRGPGTSLRCTGSMGRTVSSERTGSLGLLGRPPLCRCGRGFWLATIATISTIRLQMILRLLAGDRVGIGVIPIIPLPIGKGKRGRRTRL